MRGNLRRLTLGMLASGSIPAYAGEPMPPTAPAYDSRVYPRVCGGTNRGAGWRYAG